MLCLLFFISHFGGWPIFDVVTCKMVLSLVPRGQFGSGVDLVTEFPEMQELPFGRIEGVQSFY